MQKQREKEKIKTNKHKKGKARKYVIKTFIIFKKSLHRKKTHYVYLLTAIFMFDKMQM